MSELTQVRMSEALVSLAEGLDIPPSKYREAVERYQAVGAWLDAEQSPLKRHGLAIYAQGSFRIGTVVRPIKDGKEADYDIDLVCELRSPQERLNASELKGMVGDRLKDHATYQRLLDDEGRRCWTLNYAESDGIGFHLDVLPALHGSSEGKQALRCRGVSEGYTRLAIEITERLGGGRHAWVPGGSNPAGFASWFESINAQALSKVRALQKRALFEGHRKVFSSIEDVPDGLLRSPLQRAIQLLKRHRDVRFAGYKWESEKPISMILTTLAGRAYQGEEDLEDALAGILERIDDFATSGVIENRKGDWWIPNPVNPGENFADRWNDEGSHRAEAFFEWVAWLRQDLSMAEGHDSIEKRHRALSEVFGVGPGARLRKSGSVVAVAEEMVPSLGSSDHCQRPDWPMRKTAGRVRVVGSVHRPEGGKRLWRMSQRPVPKNRSLRFKAEVRVQGPYEVHWQVVNTGVEASAAGSAQLRGGFEQGEGVHGDVRWEHTAYTGTHWVEAFVIQNGTCVARSGRVYVRVR